MVADIRSDNWSDFASLVAEAGKAGAAVTIDASSAEFRASYDDPRPGEGEDA